MMRAIGVLPMAGAVLVCALTPAASASSSGEITRALASGDWSSASIAGSVTWGGCPQPPAPPPSKEFPPEKGDTATCDWTPYVTVAPGSDPSECKSTARGWPDLGAGVTLTWMGGEQKAPGSLGFDVSGVPLSGGEPQLACLSLIETAPMRVICTQEIPNDCPPWKMGTSIFVVDAVALTELPPLYWPPGLGPPLVANEPLSLKPKKKCRKKSRQRGRHAAARKCGKKRSGSRGHKGVTRK
jgi:hypothetical protein